jgi:DegV family protein with EDD domain
MVKIVTDSTADLPKELAAQHGIHVVPLTIFFGEEAYKDGIDLTPETFLEKLKAAKDLPTTSQPSPGDFAQVYKNLTEDGSEVVSIHLSSALSGTYQSAVMGKDMVEGASIFVIDTKSATIGVGIMVLEAAKMAVTGASGAEVAEHVQRLVSQSSLHLAVDTLEYLQKGGRIGRAQGLLGSLLNIKPILYLVDGVVTPAEKVRGFNKALARMAELVLAQIMPEDKVIYGVAHIASPQGAEIVMQKVRERYPNAEFLVYDGGPVIGAHVGPGTVGLIAQKII